eukprot:1120616-Rhodomonas_salina.1
MSLHIAVHVTVRFSSRSGTPLVTSRYTFGHVPAQLRSRLRPLTIAPDQYWAGMVLRARRGQVDFRAVSAAQSIPFACSLYGGCTGSHLSLH